MTQIEFEIPKGYILDKEASTDSKLVYKKACNLPKSWEEFVKNRSIVENYYIDYDSRIAKRAPTTLNPKTDRNICFTKDRAEAILALTQLLNLIDEYKKEDKLSIEYSYYSIVYSQKSNKLIVLKTTNLTLFSFWNEELAIKFCDNFEDLLTTALEFVPYYN